MIIKTIAILGGTGFVGRHLVNALSGQDYRIRVLTRRRERHRELLVIPTLDLIESDVHDPAELTRQLAGCDAVINLVGILNERGDDGSGFR
nr:NAD(P)H-binding protein [Gammaproteobacteria bacterium]